MSSATPSEASDKHEQAAQMLSHLQQIIPSTFSPDKEVELAQKSLEEKRSDLGEDSPETLSAFRKLCKVYESTNDERTEDAYRDCLSRHLNALGEFDDQTIIVTNSLAIVLGESSPIMILSFMSLRLEEEI